MNEWIQSPNLANPWSIARTCGTYDPWFATKQALVGLVTDLITTTATGVMPIPTYVAVQPKPREVTGFTVNAIDSERYLEPIKQGQKADLTLGLDMGPWTGIPCAVVFSPTSTRPLLGGYYSIAGIRAEACNGKNNNRFIVSDSTPSGVNQNQTHSGCAMCYLNPYSAAVGAAAIAAYSVPALKIAVGTLFSGISFAKKLHNSIDVPHRYVVDVDEVKKTYDRFSFIPKRCVRRLSKGNSCRHVFLTKSEKKQDPQ